VAHDEDADAPALAAALPEGTETFVYECAGLRLCCDRELAGLAGRRVAGTDGAVDGRVVSVRFAPAPGRGQGAATEVAGIGAGALASRAATEVLFAGQGRVGGRLVPTECRLGSHGYEIAVARGGRWQVAADGGEIALLATDSGGDALLEETLMGPCVCLALAARSTFCLHAGSVLRGGRAVAFVGASGLGKSTLARWLGEEAVSPWRRLTDDVLPVRARVAGEHGPIIVCSPDFPQAGMEARAEVPSELALGAVFRLDEPAAGAEAGVTVERLGGADAAVAVTANTVAAALFGPRLRARHFGFATRLCESVPVFGLSYPRRRECLPAVEEAVARALDPPNGHAPSSAMASPSEGPPS
jgi:hypothetical protein